VSVSAACWVYEIDTKSKSMALLVKFRTDFAEHESSQVSPTGARLVYIPAVITM
jgi:hypothetical protein